MPHTPPETVEERFEKAFNPAYYAHSTWIEGNEEQLLSFIHQEITRARGEVRKEARQIRAVGFELDDKGKYTVAKFYTADDKLWAIEVDEVEHVDIPERLATFLIVRFKSHYQPKEG